MNTAAVNEAFKEALEAESDGEEVFSMEFVQHHEAELERKAERYRRLNTLQNIVFFFLLAALVLAIRFGYLHIQSSVGNNLFLRLIFLWMLIALNSQLISRRNRLISGIEKQLSLIGVYKNIVEKSAKNKQPDF